jgi:hypothetical protein
MPGMFPQKLHLNAERDRMLMQLLLVDLPASALARCDDMVMARDVKAYSQDSISPRFTSIKESLNTIAVRRALSSKMQETLYGREILGQISQQAIGSSEICHKIASSVFGIKK